MNTQEWISHVEDSIHKALRGESKLDEFVLGIKGFSTPTMRHLFNNLASKAQRYLEVGLYAGGTACAALYKNKDLNSFLFENQSQSFGNDTVFDELQENIIKVQPHAGTMNVLWEDFFEWSEDLESNALSCDMIFYDGEHSAENQRRAVFECSRHSDKTFILIVDDFSWNTVGEPTKQAISEAGLNCLKSWELYGATKNDDSIWHNGLGIFLLERL